MGLPDLASLDLTWHTVTTASRALWRYADVLRKWAATAHGALEWIRPTVCICNSTTGCCEREIGTCNSNALLTSHGNALHTVHAVHVPILLLVLIVELTWLISL